MRGASAGRSSDGSAALLAALARDHAWLRPVILTRNYGQSSALQAGFDRVRGRYVVTLDADLQNDPLDVPILLQRLETDPTVDMVSAWRQNRQDAAISRKLPSLIDNQLISRATRVRLHDHGCALKAYRRPIIDRTFRALLDLVLIVFFCAIGSVRCMPSAAAGCGSRPPVRCCSATCWPSGSAARTSADDPC